MTEGHFVFQRVRVSAGRPLHLAAHLEFAARAFERIYGGADAASDGDIGMGGGERGVDERDIAEPFSARSVSPSSVQYSRFGSLPATSLSQTAGLIANVLRAHRVPARGNAAIILTFYPDDEGRAKLQVGFERALLEAGYTHSPLRPKAVTYEYSIPFGGFPTGFQLSARALYDTLALTHHEATRSVRREGEVLVSCGDAPLFAIRGKSIVTTPLVEGATDSVERRLVIEAAGKARLRVIEEPLRHSELRDYDELFLADAAGITSIAECDGAKFMSLAAARVAEAMNSVEL